MLGCDSAPGTVGGASKASERGSSTGSHTGAIDEVDILTGPHTTTILAVMKDDNPFVLMDMLPEAKILLSLTPAAQREYLLKRALVTLVDKVLPEKKYEGKDTFVVKMILLNEKDEYGKPQWGSAPVIALLHVPRTAVEALKIEKIANFDRPEVDKLVQVERLDLASLATVRNTSP